MKGMQATSTALRKPLQIIALTLSFNVTATAAQAFTFSTIGTWNNAIGGNVTYTSGVENRATWGQFDPQVDLASLEKLALETSTASWHWGSYDTLIIRLV